MSRSPKKRPTTNDDEHVAVVSAPMEDNHGVARVQFELSLPPGINSQYSTVNGRRVLSAEARRWKKAAAGALAGVFDAPFREQARAGYLAVFIDFYFETPLRRDLDGGLKIALDLICEVLGVDDRRVVDIHLVKRIEPLRPHMTVELEVVPTWSFDEERPVL
jgi:crossover junction endodeoxyribonuclease RusA